MVFENIGLVDFIKRQFQSEDFIPLHSPFFLGNEKKYVNEAIDSTFVSSVGKFVDRFEEIIKEYTGSKFAIATVNGTSALHMSLILAGVNQGDLVITQALSFIATCNAISYLKAEPVFVDVDLDTLGLSPSALEMYLKENTYLKNGNCFHSITNQRIAAVVPMHTFGHPAKIQQIASICEAYKIILVEDAAESIGSFSNSIHTGNFGTVAAFSFNGNKTVTCGGGGVIITNNERLGKLGKHLTTQAKVPHKWEFVHDQIGYNYRMPNINAALACAQMEQIEKFIENKRQLALTYKEYFRNSEYKFIDEPLNARSNFWLNAIMTKDLNHRNEILELLNNSKVMARPSWALMHKLQMFENCLRGPLDNSEWIEERLINIPSSYRP
ncbi:LegC family aminotransferase [Sediminibacterium sp.]|uniref:LegC family aminotransferase n=1 Tax=Sediminibacterium sp. TaxID=1917865 RepID=UPI0025CD81EE|nr:LegC family aminotransferase [Sediminibacterium sp.]